MQHRGLLLLATVYRPWAECRLHQLQQWAEGWKHPGAYAAFKGVGAEDMDAIGPAPRGVRSACADGHPS
eukprot:3278392-Alexandrium_andersonii.AAC.1